MIHINLLPWREQERKAQQRAFGGALVLALLVTAILLFAWQSLVKYQISYQQSRNDFLTAEIAKVDEKLKEIADLDRTKARILARMQVIQDLQAQRPEAVHLMDELVSTMPEGVYLTSLQQSGRSVQLLGQAQSNARVSALMRNTEGSEWLASPRLQVVENKGQDKAASMSDFRLTVNQKRQQGTEENQESAGVGQ